MTETQTNIVELKTRASSENENLLETVSTARKILHLAREEATEIRNEAKANAARVEREAAQKGFVQARNSVFENVSHLESLYARSREQLQSEIMRVALTLAEEIVGISIDMYPEALAKRVEEAMRMFPNPRPVQIFVSKSEVAGVKASMERFKASKLPALEYAICADPELEAGSARVKTNHITMELDMWTHLSQLKERLNDLP